MDTGIFNAKVEAVSLEINIDSPAEELVIKLQVRSQIGIVYVTFPYDKMPKLMQVLDIRDYRKIVGSPCQILVVDDCFRDLGNFMFYHYDFIPFEKENDDWVWGSEDRKQVLDYTNEED
jgi:hypothetical protein